MPPYLRMSNVGRKALLEHLQKKYGPVKLEEPKLHLLRNICYVLGAGASLVGSFFGYRLLYLGKPVYMPFGVEFIPEDRFRHDHVRNDVGNSASNYRDLLILRDRNNNTRLKQINLGLLERLINFQLLHDLTKDRYVRNKFGLPFLLSEFSFQDDYFLFEANYEPKEVKGGEGFFELMMLPQVLHLTVLMVEPPEPWYDIRNIKVEKKYLSKRIDLLKTLTFRVLEPVGKEGIDGSLFEHKKSEFLELIIHGNVNLSGAGTRSHEVRFIARYVDAHRYSVEIIGCDILGDDGVKTLW